MALQEICKSFTALYFEALCFNEVAEFNDPVFAPLLQLFKIWLNKRDWGQVVKSEQ